MNRTGRRSHGRGWLRLVSVVSAAGIVALSAGMASADSSFGTHPVSISHTPALPQTAITSVRTGVHAGFDRVVIATAGPLSAATVTFVPRVISDPKGDVVPMPGGAYLTITVHSVAWTGTLPFPARITVNGPELLAAVRTQQFEGYVTIALGLRARTGFRVLQAEDANLLIVDVQDPPTGPSLPRTGAPLLPLVLAALAALGGGSALVVAARRRI